MTYLICQTQKKRFWSLSFSHDSLWFALTASFSSGFFPLKFSLFWSGCTRKDFQKAYSSHLLQKLKGRNCLLFVQVIPQKPPRKYAMCVRVCLCVMTGEWVGGPDQFGVGMIGGAKDNFERLNNSLDTFLILRCVEGGAVSKLILLSI